MNNEVLFRDLSIDQARTEGQTVPASLSSEFPYFRLDGWEILSHEPQAIVLDRAAGGLPLLINHEAQRLPIGKAENVRVEGGRLRADLRFGERQEAQEVLKDIKSGILGPLSVGYEVIDTEGLEEKREGSRQYKVTKWRPLEVSLASIPADYSVGVGRSLELQKERNTVETSIHTPDESGVKVERQRVASIREYAKVQTDIPEHIIDKAIDGGWDTMRLARNYMDWKREQVGDYAAPNPEIGLTQSEANRFSFARAIEAMSSGNWEKAGFERSASQAVARQLGREPNGVFVPPEVLGRTTISKSGTGDNIIATHVLANHFIDILRNRSMVIQAGATELPGLVGDVSIPSKTTASTGYWVAENAAITESTPVFSAISMAPNTLGGLTRYSRKMLLQSTPHIEQLLRQDLADTLAAELDRVCIEGSGTGAEPEGILNNSSVTAVALGADGAAPDYDNIVDMVKTVAASSADSGRLAFLTNAAVQAALRKTEKFSSTGDPIWESGSDGEGRLLGYRALVSENVPSDLTKGTGTDLSGIIFGNFADLLIGRWGALEIVANPYGSNDFSQGITAVRAMLDTDVAVRRAASFSKIVDAVA